MLDLRQDVSAVGEARAAAAADFARLGVPADLAQDGLLVTSELVANAVRHGRAPVRLEITGGARRVVIKVHDTATAIPELREPTDDGGRGLEIVAGLAADWGYTPYEDSEGKCVWAELAW